MTAGNGPAPSGTERYAITVSFPLRYDTVDVWIFSPATVVVTWCSGEVPVHAIKTAKTAILISLIDPSVPGYGFFNIPEKE